MAAPKYRLQIGRTVGQDHDDIAYLVRAGLELVDCPARTEVHVTRALRRKGSSGRAYYDLPDIASMRYRSSEWLITMRLPIADNWGPFPRIDQTYHGSRKKTRADWPKYTLANWREELLHLAAHEGRHIFQFNEGIPHSEMDAERRAKAALWQWHRRQSG